MNRIQSNQPEDRHQTLLLIDPDRDNREIAATVLRLAGFDVIPAASPKEGLRLARQKKPTVIVTELFRRTKHGWFIVEALKRYPTTRDIPVLAYTAYALQADADAALHSGADSFAPKPMNPSALPGLVIDLLNSGEEQERGCSSRTDPNE